MSRENSELFAGNFSIVSRPMDLNDAIENADELLYNAAKELINFYLKSKKTKNN